MSRFRIDTLPGTSFASNPQASAAFERAAAAWESFLADPIAVLIDVDFDPSIPSGSIGLNSPVWVGKSFNGVRDAIAGDASGEADAIASSVPRSGSIAFRFPAGSGWGTSGFIKMTKANMKAIGVDGLDDDFGNADAVIRFNAQFEFDYDRSDGITPGSMDFETVAMHEIGHALGFSSAVDDVDAATGPTTIHPQPLDLFRFADGSSDDPGSLTDFETFGRSLKPNSPDVIDDTVVELPMSTGQNLGDGNQASHWRDDALAGFHIGVMDPTLAPGEVFTVEAADRKALDLIGWDVVEPLPALCDTAPATGCRSGATGRSSLQIKDRASDAKDQLRWKLKDGDTTALADFLDPVSGTADYRLCLYDSSTRAQPLLESGFYPAGTCDGKPCWQLSSGGDRYKYRNRAGLPEGVESIDLRSGAAGAAQVSIKAEGERFEAPALDLTMPVTIQLIADDGARECWQTVFSGTPSRDTIEEFKASGP